MLISFDIILKSFYFAVIQFFLPFAFISINLQWPQKIKLKYQYQY